MLGIFKLCLCCHVSPPCFAHGLYIGALYASRERENQNNHEGDQIL